MLIHSYLYYRADTPIIDDALWTKWAQQLAKLHDKFGKRIGFYDKAFADWDGSTGFHLPADYDVVRVAQNLYREHAERLEIIG